MLAKKVINTANLKTIQPQKEISVISLENSDLLCSVLMITVQKII